MADAQLPPSTTPGKNEKIMKLRALINENPDEGWDLAWKQDVKPWENGESQPPLREFFESRDSIIPSASVEKRALVPGCGKGYDAAYLAGLGYTAWGVDLSPTAVEEAREWAKENVDEDTKSRLSFDALDFFKFDIPKGGFDVVYDYTRVLFRSIEARLQADLARHPNRFFCAIPPALREPWGARMRELVKPGGILITQVYPIDGPRTGGPPYSVSVDLVRDSLQRGGTGEPFWDQVADMVPKNSMPDHGGRERLVVWKRTLA